MSKLLDDLLQDLAARIEAGTPPWRRPWSGGASPSEPLRADGGAFSGANAWSLAYAGAARGYASPWWFTFRQALALGAPVRKGERGVPAVLWRQARDAAAADEADGSGTDAGELGRRPGYLASYVVFNAEQLDGAPERFLAAPAADPVVREAVRCAALEAVPARIELGGAMACYSPGLDLIRLPPPELFESAAEFLATKAHELAHWTGAPHRLARSFGRRFGDAAYAFEELVAELASVLLGLKLGLPPASLDNHAAYIAGWAGILKARPRALLEASGHAQRAVDFLLAFSRAEDGQGAGHAA